MSEQKSAAVTSGGERRIVSPDTFHRIRASVVAYGGVGAGRYSLHADQCMPCFYEDQTDEPVCLGGHAFNAFGSTTANERKVFAAFGIQSSENDVAVRAINARKGKQGDALDDRVSFEEFCEEIGVVCGEELSPATPEKAAVEVPAGVA